MEYQLDIFAPRTQQTGSQSVVNVASVPQRSPFRYPGGKTWLIPTIRAWMKNFNPNEIVLIEPFAGGGIVGLTAAFECLAKKIVMVERDDEVAAVWETIFNGKNEWLAEKIYTFELLPDNVKKELGKNSNSKADIAFATILKNRIYHGGIIAKGAGLIKEGENGKGIASRWYPKTLRDRILSINRVKHKIDFIHGDAFDIINRFTDDRTAVFFLDPPYTVASKRLYTHFDIDHERLFEMTRRIKGHFLMTYDDTEEVRRWAEKYSLKYKTVPMKTTHHWKKNELLISDNLDW